MPVRLTRVGLWEKKSVGVEKTTLAVRLDCWNGRKGKERK